MKVITMNGPHIIGGLILTILTMVYFLVHPDSPPVSDGSSVSAMTITATTAQQGEWSSKITAAGPITAWQEAIVSAEIEEQQLVSVFVDVGDKVEKGETLAQFNTETLLAEQAELKASWKLAKADAQRALSLKGTGAISNQQIDIYVNQEAIAKARLEVKNLRIRYATVKAPDSGIISSRSATLGEVGSFGQELFRIIRQERLEWRGELTANQLEKVEIGQKVLIRLPGDTTADASIRQIAPSVDPSSRMAMIYADILSTSTARAGMYGEGQIILPKTPLVFVPSESVIIRDGYSYVFKLVTSESQTGIAQQKIAIGRKQGKYVEILAGIDVGDRVAERGAGFLNDGDVVTVVESVPVVSGVEPDSEMGNQI